MQIQCTATGPRQVLRGPSRHRYLVVVIIVFVFAGWAIGNFVDQPIFFGLLGRQKEIAIGVVGDFFGRLTRVLGQHLIQYLRFRKISSAWISISLTWPFTPP